MRTMRARLHLKVKVTRSFFFFLPLRDERFLLCTARLSPVFSFILVWLKRGVRMGGSGTSHRKITPMSNIYGASGRALVLHAHRYKFVSFFPYMSLAVFGYRAEVSLPPILLRSALARKKIKIFSVVMQAPCLMSHLGADDAQGTSQYVKKKHNVLNKE